MEDSLQKSQGNALKDRFAQLRKMSQEAMRQKTETESPIASLMARFPDLRNLGVQQTISKKEALPVVEEAKAPSPEVRGDSTLDQSKEEKQKNLRKSILGEGPKIPPAKSPGLPDNVKPLVRPTKKVTADELFLSSVAADDDEWLQFQVEEKLPASEQVAQLQLWLKQNRPSQVHRSQGVGWIAVKIKNKAKKVLEAKAAWEVHEGEKTMAVVNALATKFNVQGGKWMCHLPRDGVDAVWSKMGMALLGGGLGQHVYMVKVSPVEDINPEQSRGEHVLVVYNTDYSDTEQVMRVEHLIRSAGVYFPLTYKPDIFSALGIYRNNKWGFRPTIYSSRALLSEGRSRVETVGTGKWFWNSSRGLQFPEAVHKGVETTEALAGEEEEQNKLVASNDLAVSSKVQQLRTTDMSSQSLSSHSVSRMQPTSSSKTEGRASCLLKQEVSSSTEIEEGTATTKSEKLNTKHLPGAAENKNQFVKKGSIELPKKDSKSKKVIGKESTSDGSKIVENNIAPNIVKPNAPKGEKDYPKTTNSVSRPMRVQPDWLAKLEELKLRSLDQF